MLKQKNKALKRIYLINNKFFSESLIHNFSIKDYIKELNFEDYNFSIN